MRLAGFPAALALTLVPLSAAAEVREVANSDELVLALNEAVAGDEIVLTANEYTLGEAVNVALEGTTAAPIVIRGSGGTRPFVGSTLSDAPALSITGSFLRIEDLEIRGIGEALALSGENIVVDGVLVTDATAGILCTGCAGLTVANTEFTNIGPGAAFAGTATTDAILGNNWVHDVTGPGFTIEGTGNLLNDNVLVDAGITAVESSDAGAFTIVDANYLRGAGIELRGAGVIRNNIVWEADDGIVSDLGAPAGASDVVIHHNTVVAAAQNCFVAREWAAVVGAPVVANNAFYCPDSAATLFETGVGANTIVTANIYLGTSDFPGDGRLGVSLAADFEDAAAGNFYPTADSALLDLGEGAYTTAVDFNGSGRAAPPDVGAYERTQGANPFPDIGTGFKIGGQAPDGDMGGGPDAGGGGADAGEDDGRGATGLPIGSGNAPPEDEGCQCGVGAASGIGSWLLLVLVVLLGRRRARN